jgi:hypothetical protein
MTVRTARLAVGTSGAAGASNTIYTCPPGVTTIVKDIRLNGRADPSSTYIIFVASGPLLTYLGSGTLNINATVSIPGFVVLEPSDRIGINSGIAAGIGFWISGSELAGIAPNTVQGLPA